MELWGIAEVHNSIIFVFALSLQTFAVNLTYSSVVHVGQKKSNRKVFHKIPNWTLQLNIDFPTNFDV